LLTAIQAEINRHDFSHFIDDPLSIAEGRKSVVVAGCPPCRKPLASMAQFIGHLTNDAPRQMNRVEIANLGKRLAAILASGNVRFLIGTRLKAK